MSGAGEPRIRGAGLKPHVDDTAVRNLLVAEAADAVAGLDGSAVRVRVNEGPFRPLGAILDPADRSDVVREWLVELLDETPSAERPAPFTAQQHAFTTQAAALEWLGIQEADATTKPAG